VRRKADAAVQVLLREFDELGVERGREQVEAMPPQERCGLERALTAFTAAGGEPTVTHGYLAIGVRTGVGQLPRCLGLRYAST
jgi:acyl transferase domain-containing protein